MTEKWISLIGFRLKVKITHSSSISLWFNLSKIRDQVSSSLV